MKENLMVICFDYALSRRISKSLAEFLDMRLFDMIEMFAFNNAPYNLSEVIDINGEDFAIKEMRGVLKMELDCSNSVFVAEPKMIALNQDLFEKMKQHNLILFLKRDYKTDFLFRDKMMYRSEKEQAFFKLEIDELSENAISIENDLADIVIDIEDLGFEQIKEKIINILENFAS